MNWLSHALLSRRDIAFQVGNILADPLKGRAWPGASRDVLDGMLMHKAIDKFTDAHPHIAVSKSRLGERGLLRGVALDVMCDHFLSVRWDQYARVPIRVFLEQFHREAADFASTIPQAPKAFIERMVQSEMLSSYTDIDGVAAALQRVDARLSPRLRARETTSEYLQAFEAHYDHLLADFDRFFPDLVAFFNAHPLGGIGTSYLRE